MQSHRFGRQILITRHARERMIERSIDEPTILDLIETGQTRYKDRERLWIYRGYFARTDNLLCVAVSLTNDALVVKTVMHHFDLS